MPMRVICLVGARPNFIKCAPLLAAFTRHPKAVTPILVHTGQHYDAAMSGVFFDELGLPQPDRYLGVGSGTHAEQTGKILLGFEPVLSAERPDWVVVFGDVNSTLAGALAAAKLGIPVAHVEAGLRSFNKAMAEELNRVLTDHLSSLLFCPTDTAVKQLADEGIRDGVHLVGDVMYDAFLMYRELAQQRSTILQQLQLSPKRYCLATIHRAESTDHPERLSAIMAGLAQSREPIVMPVHPRTRKQLDQLGADLAASDTLRLIDPVSYLDMLLLEQHAAAIVTDSGGVQKEACFSRVPCLTLREETEWVETVASGWNELVGTDAGRIRDAIQRVAASVGERTPSGPPPAFGDGQASRRIAEALLARR